MFTDFKFSRFLITIAFEDNSFDGVYCHNFFRGVLGVYLKKFACICTNPNKHARDCKYMQMFESKPLSYQGQDHNFKNIPKPYAIYSSQVQNRTATLDLVIFGEPFQNYIHYFIFSIREMGRNGIGENRQRFHIRSVKNKGEDILVEGSELLRRPYSESFTSKNNYSDNQNLLVHFATPCWLTYGGDQQVNFSAPVFVQNLIRRLQLLYVWYQEKQSDDLETLRSILPNTNFEAEGHGETISRTRYSSRQKRNMPTGGFVGTYEFKKLNPSFLPLLELGSIIQVGKKTTFGNGKYFLEVVNA